MVRKYFYGLILISVILTGLVNGQYIFQDDFENVAPGIVNDPNSDADPEPLIGTWFIGEDPNSGAQVIDALDPGANHGDQYLSLDRFATYAPSGVAGVYAVLLEPANEKTFVTFDFYQESGSHTIQLIDSADGGIYTSSDVTVWLVLTPSGSVYYYDFGLGTDTGITYSLNQWHQLRIEVNPSTGNFNLYLDGMLAAADLGFQQPFNTQFQQIQLYNDVNPLPSRWYIDNLRVEEGTTECPTLLPADFNGDCQVTLVDLTKMVSQWLDCNVDPQELCF